MKLASIVAALSLAAAAPCAVAQDVPDPSSAARVRFGPLALNPTIALTNLGIDDNVFNEPDQALPKDDFTFTITPAADAWLRMGPAWLSGTVREELVYYRTYSSERSANDRYRLGLTVPLNRVTLTANGSYLNAKERPGYEIDARIQRVEASFDGSVEVRALTKTYFGLRARQTMVDYADDAFFQGVNLSDELNHTLRSASVTVRHQLTSLTTLTFEGGRDQDRFDHSPLRDADSTRIVGGVVFDKLALIKGSASIGYRDFRPLSGELPGYKGSTAAVDLSYELLGSTRLGVQVGRDIQYSYDVTEPYYLLTGLAATADQQVYGPVDVIVRGGVQRLDYQEQAGASVTPAGRLDRVYLYGAGVGYRIGRDVRVGFDVDHRQRTSPLESHRYSGLRFGASATYGF